MRIDGKGVSEAEAKARQVDAEKEQIKKIENSVKFEQEKANHLMDRIKEEESKAQDMLNKKIELQNNMAIVNDDLEKEQELCTKNREELIKLQIKKSQLEKQEERLEVELDKVAKENDAFHLKNDELEKENKKLEAEILATIQRIDINSLLKEIDVEDMRLLAQNNQLMNKALNGLINKWGEIQKPGGI